MFVRQPRPASPAVFLTPFPSAGASCGNRTISEMILQRRSIEAVPQPFRLGRPPRPFGADSYRRGAATNHHVRGQGARYVARAGDSRLRYPAWALIR